ncbi:MAG: alpha/beta hydrolase [Hyphomonadaceae bacterium]|nr:alpha/beta hydrolase [Hyphomonadaceae bacterium]
MTTAMPPVSFVETNGIRMAVYEAGPADQAPPLVLCHGFPELAFSWRHQLRDLPKHGLRVIAPDQRGYGLTDRPAPVEAYDMHNLCADLVGLLDAKGVDKAVFCGHDWGGFVVWQMALRHPDRVAGVIGLNTPHMARLPADPIMLMRMRFGEDMYIVYFQKPGEADALLGADVEKSMRMFMRRSAMTQEAFAALPESQRNFALVRGLEEFTGAEPGTSPLLSPEELAVYVEAFSRTGFTGPINWYRNFTRNWEQAAAYGDEIAVPCLMITAENDLVLPPSMSEGMEALIPRLSRHNVLNSGHWTQQEQPDEVTEVIAGWMARTFG